MPKETTLIDEQLVKEALETLKKIGNQGIVAIRLKAIIAAHKHGIKKVSEVYDINRSSLHRWVSVFRARKLEGIENAKKPSRAKLNQDQQEIVKTWIEGDSNITIKKVRVRIQEAFNIELSKSSIHRMILGFGFSHITGRKRHYKSDESAQIEFKKKSTRKSTK